MYEQMTNNNNNSRMNFGYQFKKTKKERANNPFPGGKHRESQQ
jgi:hypothetical protein